MVERKRQYISRAEVVLLSKLCEEACESIDVSGEKMHKWRDGWAPDKYFSEARKRIGRDVPQSTLSHIKTELLGPPYRRNRHSYELSAEGSLSQSLNGYRMITNRRLSDLEERVKFLETALGVNQHAESPANGVDK